MRDLSGRQLGQYELRGIIRRGGMSAVYQAYQPSLHRLVAVKVLAFPGDPEFVARFEREARAIAALQHPNVVRVYDYGEQDGQAYLVMQYVEDGVTLVDLLREPQAPIRCLELMEHVLAGLAYAHGRGIVHRDVKPSNILLASPTWPMLADFGVAKLLAEESLQLTATGVVAGTPAYMAPEQAFRLPVDARTDLYAAGVVLYEMLTGRVPFDAGTPVATLMLHAYEPPPPPRELNPALPEELAALLLKALRKDPAERYQSADEMGAAVQAARVLLERPSRRLAALTPPGSEPRAASHHAAHGAPAVAGQLAGQPAGSGTAAAGTPAGTAAPGPPVAAKRVATARPRPEAAAAARPASPRRPWREVAGGWLGDWRRLAFVAAAVAALLGGSIWGAGLFGANQAQALEVILSARDVPGTNPFTPPVTRSQQRFAPGAIGEAGAKQGVLRLSGDRVGLYGGTMQQQLCDREQMIGFLMANRDRAAAWVAALNSDPTLRWRGGARLTVADLPAYMHELTPVLLRLDTRVTNNGYRDGHAVAFQAILQAGTAVLIDRFGVPRARCACGNPLLEPTTGDLTRTSRYDGTAWQGFKAATIVTVAPAARPLGAVKLVDVDKGAKAVFARPAGTTGTRDAPVALTPQLAHQVALDTIIDSAAVILPPPSTAPPLAAPPSTDAGATATLPSDTAAPPSSGVTGTETLPPSSAAVTPSGSETTTSSTDGDTSTSPSSTGTSSSEPPTSSGGTSTSTSSDTTGSNSSDGGTSSSLATSTTAMAVAVLPAAYRKTADGQLPPSAAYQIGFRRVLRGGGRRWRRHCEGHDERSHRSPAWTV